MIEGLGFEGSTYGLEDQLLEFISMATSSVYSLLLEDYLDEESMPEDAKAFNRELAKFPNIALLMSLWSIYCPHQERLTTTEFWDAIDLNIETSFQTNRDTKLEKTYEVRIHYLFQLKEIYYDEHDDAGTHIFEKWKVCLLRTGLRDEYLQKDAIGLLTAQRLIVSRVFETKLENVSAEIIWLRYGQRESVVDGATKEDAERLATNYFDGN